MALLSADFDSAMQQLLALGPEAQGILDERMRVAIIERDDAALLACGQAAIILARMTSGDLSSIGKSEFRGVSKRVH